jgi:hypothetical protein
MQEIQKGMTTTIAMSNHRSTVTQDLDAAVDRGAGVLCDSMGIVVRPDR